MISLASIQRSVVKPPKIVIYGVPGIGKTKWASCAPRPIFICAEDGLGQLDVPHFPRARSFQDVMEALVSLHREQHDFGTVVVDTIDAVEPMIWAHVCSSVPHEKGRPIQGIEDYGFGKGYVHAQREWLRFLTALDALRDDRGMAVILCAHSKVSTFKSPESDDYDRYALKINEKADAVVSGWTDCKLFANYETHLVETGRDGDRKRGAGTGRRLLFTEERPAFAAKNRYSLPPVLPLDWNAFVAAQAAAITAARPDLVAPHPHTETTAAIPATAPQ